MKLEEKDDDQTPSGSTQQNGEDLDGVDRIIGEDGGAVIQDGRANLSDVDGWKQAQAQQLLQ